MHTPGSRRFPRPEVDAPAVIEVVARVVFGDGLPKAEAARAGVSGRLPIQSPDVDQALLRDGGFNDVEMFYAGLAFRGWVAYA